MTIEMNKWPGVPISRVILACVLVAALDGAFAVALYVYALRVCSPPQLMQSIAAALLGRDAFRGGTRTVVLGLVLHFAVACGWTLVYVTLRASSVRLHQMTETTRGALIVGAAFGVFVWLAMDLLVVPLSRASATPVWSSLFIVLLVWHAVGVGIPLALIVREPSGRASPAMSFVS